MIVALRRPGALSLAAIGCLVLTASVACARIINAPTISLLTKAHKEGVKSAAIKVDQRFIFFDEKQIAALMEDLRRVEEGDIAYGSPRGAVLDKAGDGFLEITTVFGTGMNFQYFKNGTVSFGPGNDGVRLDSLRIWNYEGQGQ